LLSGWRAKAAALDLVELCAFFLRIHKRLLTRFDEVPQSS
jgi:hypothetical protein